MRLSEKLRRDAEEFARTAPPGKVAVIQNTIARLAASGAANRALKAGDAVPAFALHDTGGDMVHSSALLRKGPLIVHFYRGVW